MILGDITLNNVRLTYLDLKEDFEKIYQLLFLNKEVITDDFCEQHYLSKSTLK